MQKVAARRRQLREQRQQGASESRARICKGRCSKWRQEECRGEWGNVGKSGCCREDVAAASAVANCASKPPKAKVLLATTQSRAAVVEGKSSSSAGGGRGEQGRGRGSLA